MSIIKHKNYIRRFDMIVHLLEHCTGVILADRYTVNALIHRKLLSSSRTQLSTLRIHGDIDDDRLRSSERLTDASITLISTYCSRLQSLHVTRRRKLTDSSIITISIHCTGLQSLFGIGCDLLTDASTKSISNHCTGIKKIIIG